MKYKKLLIFITSLIFFTTLIFSSVFLFRIAEIDLTVNSVVGSNENVNGVVSTCLEEYKGKNLIFVNTNKLEDELENISGYVKVKSIDKAFPNKLQVTVEERVEIYAINYQDEYWVLDEDFKTLTKKAENVNNINGLPNVLLDVNISDFNETSLKSSSILSFYDEYIQNSFNEIKDLIVSRKENIKSIKVNVRSDGQLNRYFSFTMTEGMEIQIDKVNISTKDKLLKLFDYYDSCENKGDAIKRYVTLKENGEISVV